MSRFVTTLGALGLSLAATSAFAHGGGSHGSMGGFEQGIALTGPQTGLSGGGKVQVLTDHDSNHDRRNLRELAERQRIQTEVTSLKTRAFLLVEKLQMLTTAKGDPREIARLTEEIRHLGNRIGMLQHEEKAPT